MSLADQEDAVLAMYALEAGGHLSVTPLAGLKLGAYRAARARLVEQGRLVRTPAGRYIPVKGLGVGG